MDIRVIRATETWQRAGAYYVRIQGMARQHGITLRGRVVVLPEYRGKGLGKRTMEEAETWLRDLDYATAVVESRDVAVGFYRKAGYTVTDGHIIHGNTFDCIRMEKPL